MSDTSLTSVAYWVGDRVRDSGEKLLKQSTDQDIVDKIVQRHQVVLIHHAEKDSVRVVPLTNVAYMETSEDEVAQ